MIHDLYSSLTAREQRALRWSTVATAAALWLTTAWADPWFLVTVPLIAGAFFVYHLRHRHDAPDEDDVDFL